MTWFDLKANSRIRVGSVYMIRRWCVCGTECPDKDQIVKKVVSLFFILMKTEMLDKCDLMHWRVQTRLQTAGVSGIIDFMTCNRVWSTGDFHWHSLYFSSSNMVIKVKDHFIFLMSFAEVIYTLQCITMEAVQEPEVHKKDCLKKRKSVFVKV